MSNYDLINWKNGPAGHTRLNADNLNHMDRQIQKNADDVEATGSAAADNAAKIAEAEADIFDLQQRPTFAIVNTSKSPLKESGSSNILAIDVLANSEQYISPNLSDVMYGKYWGTSSPTRPDSGSDGKRISIARALPVGKTYTISFKRASSEAGKAISVYCRYVDDDFMIISTTNIITISGDEAKITLNESRATKGCIFLACDNFESVSTSTIWNVMINEGSTALPYEPYTGQPEPGNIIPIVNASEIKARTSNMFDKYNITKGQRLNPQTDGSQPGVKYGWDFYPDAGYFTSEPIEVEEGKTYTKNSPAADAFHRIGYYDKDKVCKYKEALNTFVVPKGIKYVAFCGLLGEIDSTILREGTDAKYEPRKTNSINIEDLGITLRSAKDIRDELVIEEGGAGKHIRRVGYLTSTSKNGWRLQSINSYGIANFELGVPDVTTKGEDTPSFCNMGLPQHGSISNERNEGYLIHANQVLFLRIKSTTASTLDQLDTFLAAHPLVFYYELATPIVTELTREQVRQILALRTYSPETYIDSDLDVTITYAGDPKAYIEKSNIYTAEERLIGEYLGADLFRRVLYGTVSMFEIKNILPKFIYGSNEKGEPLAPGADFIVMTMMNPGTGERTTQIMATSSGYHEFIVEYTRYTPSASNSGPGGSSVVPMTLALDDDPEIVATSEEGEA